MQQFPQVAIARNLAQLLKAYQQEFGLTPSARTRIQVLDFEEPDPDPDSIWNLRREAFLEA